MVVPMVKRVFLEVAVQLPRSVSNVQDQRLSRLLNVQTQALVARLLSKFVTMVSVVQPKRVKMAPCKFHICEP